MKKNDALGVGLLALVAAVHYGYDPLAHLFYSADPQRAARAIFYIARGIEGSALYWLLLAYAPRSLPVMAACLWGALESAQTAVCRAALGIGVSAPTPGPYSGLCDLAADWPVSGLTAFVALVCAAIVQGSRDANRKK